MAIKFISPTDGLVHDTSVLQINNDFTVMLWITGLDSTGSGDDYVTYWVLHDATYTNYVGIFSGGIPNTFGLYGTGFSSTDSPMLPEYTYHVTITYDSGTHTLKYYINGDLAFTKTALTLLGPSTLEYIGYDGTGTHSNLVVQNYRSWTAVLTFEKIFAEIGSNNAVESFALKCDTPLATPSVLSGFGPAWANILNPGALYDQYDVKFVTTTANTDFHLALEIPYLPYKLVQDPSVGGASPLTYYYKITNSSDVPVIGAWAYSPHNGYGPEATPHRRDGTAIPLIVSRRKPFQFSVEPGEVYFIKATPLSSVPNTAVNYLQIYESFDILPGNGDLVVPPDQEGFPVSIIRSGGIIGYKYPFVAGEQGDAIDDGTALMAAIFEDGVPVHIYNAALEHTGVINSLVGEQKFIRAQPQDELFYVSRASGDSSSITIVHTVNKYGTVEGASYNLGLMRIGSEGSFGAICGDLGGNRLYYSNLSNEVRMWSLSSNADIGVFQPATINYRIADILVQKNGKIIISFYKDPNFGSSFFVRRYDPDGTIINNYDFGTNIGVFTPRMSYSIDNPDTFWVWINYMDPEGYSEFREIQASDGTVIEIRPAWLFKEGEYFTTSTPTPGAGLGIDPSCPFWQIRADPEPPPPPETADLIINKVVLGGPGGSSFRFSTTGGLSPNNFNLVDGESRSFLGISPGTYGVTEDPYSDYDTTYEVSNGNAHDSITLNAGDVVTVTVTNNYNVVPTPAPVAGIYKIVPKSAKPEDTLYDEDGGTFEVKIPDPTWKTGAVGE
jgi:hypothetical protein